ncbi:hypothetical protein CGCA056_v014003 [Colletotrichum aenigma]|uniref:uncharacterized protein n=1 Tax=Colletotrichum aenigma TaxID=1215731 RepID=UPI001872847F|nr:uncharacterized protein CGCA056_v014003 [Colletotrichum aenigma]KAF5502413.1 hypothetical protein CGCA056_v014003 [Colletotrichum aenigma]
MKGQSAKVDSRNAQLNLTETEEEAIFDHFVHTAQRFRNIFIRTLILINCSYLIANWYCALYVKFDHHLIRIYDDQHVKQFEFVISHYHCVFLKFNLSAVDKFHFIKQRHFFQHKWIVKLQRASQLDAYCIAYFLKLECFFGFEYFFELWYCLPYDRIFIGIDKLYNNALFKHNISFNLCQRVSDYAFGGTDNIPESYIRWFLFDFQHSRYLLIGNDG